VADFSVNCPKCTAPNTVPLGADIETYNCSMCGAVNSLVEGDVSAPVQDPLVGAVISDCKILEKLGEGGFGAVYKAMDQNLQRPVALKVMLQSLTSNQEFVQKFIREAITAAQLNHPNIVAIHKVGRDEKRGIHYLIMELLDGRTLQAMIEDKGVLKPEEAAPIILQAAEALAAAHEKKIVHRDIKPENIMVDKRGVVKIMDFGLAKVVQPDMKSTKVMGTPHYMSPEQFEGKQVDGRTDIYSLGVTFYYMLSKQRPYEGTNTVQIIYAILTSDPKSLLEASPNTPGELWTIIQKMIAKKVDERYASFRDVRKDLLSWQEKSLADRINCPGCGAKNQRGKKFCRQCGGNLQVKCPACGADEVAGSQTCSACGAAIETLLAVRQNMERAGRLKQAGDLRRAYLLLKEVLKLDPAHAQATADLAEIDAALKEVESVRTEALELEKTGNLEDALSKVEELLGRYPGSEDVKKQRDLIKRSYDGRIIAQHMKRADEAAAGGNLPAALVALDAALRLDPKREDLIARRRDFETRVAAADDARRLAREAFEGRRYAEAFRRATEVLRGNPTDAEMAQVLEKCRGFLESSEEFVRRGREHLAAGRWVEARRELEAAVQLRPDDGDVKGLLEQVEGKLSALRNALADARVALGDGKFDEARRFVSQVLASLPGDPEALGLMATIARQEQESLRASEVQKSLEEGEALEKKGELEGALNAFRSALEADPDSSKASQARDRVEARIREVSSIRALADEHLRDGRFEDALDSLEKLRKLLPDDETIQSEAEEAREKVGHISKSLKNAEKAAAAKDHKKAAAFAREVLDLSPTHVRAASLKRDAERAVAAIERHVKEAERFLASELFDEALDQVKKARAKGASEEAVAGFERTCVEGITTALKTEATRFYSARDYSAALDAYERILELRPDDSDAKKGRFEAEKRLKALTSEPPALRSVVAAAAAVILVMFQTAAVQVRQPPGRSASSSATTSQPIIAGPTLDAALAGLELAGNWKGALEGWNTQTGFEELRGRALRVLPALAGAADGKASPLDRIRALQAVEQDLVDEQDEKFGEVRRAAATAAVKALVAEARATLQRAEAADPAEAKRLLVAYSDSTLAGTQVHTSAKALTDFAEGRRGTIEAGVILQRDLDGARASGAWAGFGDTIAQMVPNAAPEDQPALRDKYTTAWRDGWKASLGDRLRGRRTDAEFFNDVQELSAFAEAFQLLDDPATLVNEVRRSKDK
jgi:tetratricopeptide (TPR) repeat protein